MAGQRAREEGVEDFYITSFSSKTIVYKGLFNAPQLAQFYGDLRSPLFETSLAVFHQRYDAQYLSDLAIGPSLSHDGP